MVHMTMVKVRCVILQFLLLMLIRKNANAENSMGIISKLLKHYHNPVIVMINNNNNNNNNNNRASDITNALRTSHKQPQVKGGRNRLIKKKKKKPVRYINDIIKSTGNKKKAIVRKTKAKFEKAIRTRCENFGQCETKCTDPDNKRNGCLGMCQKLFDELELCGKHKKEDEINISTRGPPHSVESSVGNSCDTDKCKESKNECDKSNNDCGKPKDDCDESDDNCKPKDECDESDDNCNVKDECDESDCNR